MDLHSRYLAGDCQAVRDLLRGSIGVDSTPEEIAVATAVADEFVSRSIDNLSRLYDALLAVEYQFADVAGAFVLNDPPDEDSVAAFERQMGKLPLIAARWYRRLRSVDFTQTYEQMTDRASPLAGLGWNITLVVQAFDTAIEHWRERYRPGEEAGESIEELPYLLTGGYASNNDPKGFQLPSEKFDDVFYNDGDGDQFFGDDIADAFSWRGFPVLVASRSTLRIVHTLYGEPDVEYLMARLPDRLAPV